MKTVDSFGYLTVLFVLLTRCDIYQTLNSPENLPVPIDSETNKNSAEVYQLDFRDEYTIRTSPKVENGILNFIQHGDHSPISFLHSRMQSAVSESKELKQATANPTYNGLIDASLDNINLYNLLLPSYFQQPVVYPKKNEESSTYEINDNSEDIMIQSHNNPANIHSKVGEIPGYLNASKTIELHAKDDARNSDVSKISKRPHRRHRQRQDDPEPCSMEVITIFIRFREQLETDAGDFLLECEGRIRVNKCEGRCSSMVLPDVNNFDGFSRECSCCKDSSIRTRDATLTTCTLGGQEVFGYSLTRPIVEPRDCACQACSRH